MEHIWIRENGRIKHINGNPICGACGYTYDPKTNPNGYLQPCRRGGDPVCRNTGQKSE